jgi:hypothetical protein
MAPHLRNGARSNLEEPRRSVEDDVRVVYEGAPLTTLAQRLALAAP